MAIGDGIAKGNHGAGIRWGLHINFCDLEPVIDVLGFDECGSADEIAMSVVCGGTRAGMASLTTGRRLNVERDSEIR